MAIHVGQRQQNFHLCHPLSNVKTLLGQYEVAHVFSMLMVDFRRFFWFVNSITVGEVVPNNFWILQLHRLPVDAPFSIIVPSLQVAICWHQHHGVIWILSSMNMEVLATNYSKNSIRIPYLLPRKLVFHLLFVNIICPLPPFLNHRRHKTPNLDQSNDCP